MIERQLLFELPTPWANQTFTAPRFGELTFLVGPNGSGKSRFAEVLRGILPNARILGTGRLEGMGLSPLVNIFGDNFSQGYQTPAHRHRAGAGGRAEADHLR